MRVLIVGGGGREHALAWKLAQSPEISQLFCAPGNPGIAQHAVCADVAAGDIEGILDYAQSMAIEFVVVGPEEPLSKGLVDRLLDAGIQAFGPTASAARIESSKAYAKTLMANYGIPTGRHARFDDAKAAQAYVEEQGTPIVIKADGLAAGKGVTVAHDLDTAYEAIDACLVDHAFGEAGAWLVIEEYLEGEEASIFALTDSRHILSMVSSQDHKPVYDGDTGPNTGGMGAYSPAPVITPEVFQTIEDAVTAPCVRAMASEGNPYRGVLYAGLMLTPAGPETLPAPRVVEFNCRFGDPETQVLLPRMKSDLLPLLLASCDGTLWRHTIRWREDPCVSVVMTSGGYPGPYEKGKVIEGIEAAEALEGVQVFHAGTKEEDGRLVTAGGRVLNVTATGKDIASAIDKAYAAVDLIHFEDAHYRTDIGQKALARLAEGRD